MSDNYDEEKLKELEKENEIIIEGFGNWLNERKLSDKTIQNHLSNIDFYVNTFALWHCNVDIAEAMEYHIYADFFDWFFIRKCMWSTPATIKTTAASIKKFCKYLAQIGYVGQSVYDDMKYYMKESIPEWCEDCRIYNEGGEYIDF